MPDWDDVKVDPELLRELDRAEERGEPVEAVFHLRQDGDKLPNPERVEQLSHELVDRAQKGADSGVDDVNVFRYLNSFVVRAQPAVIRTLLEQPEIASGVANRQDGAKAAGLEG